MAKETVTRRKPAPAVPDVEQKTVPDASGMGKTLQANRAEKVEHPGGDIKHGGSKQLLRFLLAATYTLASCCSYASISKS